MKGVVQLFAALLKFMVMTRRVPLWRLAVALVFGACASDPTQMYAGPTMSREQVAVLRDTYLASVFAIDDVNVYGSAWSLTPGSHSVWVRAQVTGTVPNMTYRGRIYCEIPFEASAGGTYRTAADKTEKPVGTLGKEISVDIRIVDEQGVALAYPRRCYARRPRLEK